MVASPYHLPSVLYAVFDPGICGKDRPREEACVCVHEEKHPDCSHAKWYSAVDPQARHVAVSSREARHGRDSGHPGVILTTAPRMPHHSLTTASPLPHQCPTIAKLVTVLQRWHRFRPGRTLRQWSRQCALAESAEWPSWHPGVSRCHHNQGDPLLVSQCASCGTLAFRMEAKEKVICVHIYIYIYVYVSVYIYIYVCNVK